MKSGDHVGYWGFIGVILAASVAWWGYRNMTEVQRKVFEQ